MKSETIVYADSLSLFVETGLVQKNLKQWVFDEVSGQHSKNMAVSL